MPKAFVKRKIDLPGEGTTKERVRLGRVLLRLLPA